MSATVPVWIAWIFIVLPLSRDGRAVCDRLGRRKAAQDQLDDAVGEASIDRTAGDQKPVEERSTEHVQREFEIEVGAQVTALDAALEHGAQRCAARREEALADGAGELGVAAHGVDQAGHHGGLDRSAVDLDRAAHEREQVARA